MFYSVSVDRLAPQYYQVNYWSTILITINGSVSFENEYTLKLEIELTVECLLPLGYDWEVNFPTNEGLTDSHFVHQISHLKLTSLEGDNCCYVIYPEILHCEYSKDLVNLTFPRFLSALSVK